MKQQRNAIVMQLWKNWDNALDVQTTRDDLRRFVSCLVHAKDDPEHEIWLSLFVQGHNFGQIKTRELIDNASEFIRDKFDTDRNGFTLDDITRIRASLNRFLNMVEQAAVAYLNGLGNKDVMESCMVPTLVKYGSDLLPYMDAIRAEEPETWKPIYELLSEFGGVEALPAPQVEVASDEIAGTMPPR